MNLGNKDDGRTRREKGMLEWRISKQGGRERRASKGEREGELAGQGLEV